MPQLDQLVREPLWAEKLLREVFPAAAVAEVVSRTGGQLSAVYEVRCADPAHSVIIKVYAEEWAWKQAKEVHVYGLLASRTTLKVPSVLHHTTTGGPDGRAATVLSLLEGRPLSEASAQMERTTAAGLS